MTGSIGYSSPRFIPRSSESSKVVAPGKSYFVIKIHSAQADFSAPIWQKVEGLVVTSSVSLNHPVLGTEPIRALQFSRKVKRDNPEKLGSSKNLVNFVPAIMKTVSISIDFILDTHNRMADLSNLINTGAFVASISLGPGAAVTAKTVSEISQKLISSFIPKDEQEPILQMVGDFDIATSKLLDGYYVILGSRDPKNPLPDESATMEVKDSGLLVNGEPAGWSYVILEVNAVGARTRDLNEGAVWDKKLREAEAIADLIQLDPFCSAEEKNEAWSKCKSILKDASTMLLNDDNYLRDESTLIYREAMIECSKKIFGDDTRLVKASRASSSKEIMQDRQFLGIPMDEDLDNVLNRYEHEVAKTRRLIEEDRNRLAQVTKNLE